MSTIPEQQACIPSSRVRVPSVTVLSTTMTLNTTPAEPGDCYGEKVVPPRTSVVAPSPGKAVAAPHGRTLGRAATAILLSLPEAHCWV
jgi:hypothetical protein